MTKKKKQARKVPPHKAIQQLVDLDFLRDAVDVSNANAEAPPSGWRTPMWNFARAMKALPSLAGLSGFQAVAIIQDSLAHLRPNAEMDDLWSTCFPGADDPRMDFIKSWDRVRVPGTGDVVHLALQRAKERPLKPALNYSKKYAAFVSLAGHLQRHLGDAEVALPTAKIAGLLGCDASTVAAYRRLAQNQGILLKVRDSFYSKKKAAEFRFNVELFDWQTGEQISLGQEQRDDHSYQTSQEISGVSGFKRTKQTEQVLSGFANVSALRKEGINRPHGRESTQRLNETEFNERRSELEQQAKAILKRKE